MKDRGLALLGALTIVSAVVAFAPVPLAGQAAAANASGTAKTWTAPRAPWGDPDLQGIWNNTTITPLERPKELAGREFLTEQEVAQRVVRDGAENEPREGDPGTYNNFWRDAGIASRRTSLIVDPPDGKLPPLTQEAKQRETDRAAVRRTRGPADSYEDRNRWERCLTRSLPMFPGSYNNNFQILQIPGFVVILLEMVHDVRVIPLDGRPHGTIRLWLGDSRGRWEGNTLVVDTINFTDKLDGGQYLPSHRGNMFQHRGSGGTVHLIERFTRVDENTISYEFTMDDPKTFTRPWTAVVPMKKTAGPIFEYACHEGNHGLMNILEGARADDAAGHPDLGGGSWTAGR